MMEFRNTYMNNTMDGFIIRSLISINCKKGDLERLIRDQSHRFPRLIPSLLCDPRKCDLREYIPTTSDGPETHLSLDCRCLNGSWSRFTPSPNMKMYVIFSFLPHLAVGTPEAKELGLIQINSKSSIQLQVCSLPSHMNIVAIYMNSL